MTFRRLSAAITSLLILSGPEPSPSSEAYPVSGSHITPYNELVLLDFTPFEKLFEGTQSRYISIREYAQKHGKSIEQVKVFCQQGRIRGAMKLNSRAWGVPEDAPYPEDSRMTANGKYVGRRNKSR